MPAQASRSEMSEVLPPQVAGSHYAAAPDDLSEQLARSLVQARTSSIQGAKLVIAPLSAMEQSGVVAASAFANLANRRGLVRRVVVLGPARRNALRGIAVPSHTAFSTPLGTTPIDRQNLRRLRKLTHVTQDDRGFESEAAIETVLPLLQVCLESFELTPMIVGNVYPTVVAEALEAVWGGPETLIVITSDLSQQASEDRVRATDIETRAAIETLSATGLSTMHADGHRLIGGALLRAAALDLRVTGLDFRTSSAGSGRSKGHGAFAFEPAQTARLSQPERHYLLRAVAQTVQAAAHNPLTQGRAMHTMRLPLTLSAMRATTVQIEKDGVLRGEAGGLRPFRVLLTDVTARALEAAAGDPRFPAISPGELDELRITVSITSTPRTIAVHSDDELVAALMPGRDGLVIEHRGKRSVAMPRIWENIADPTLFIAALRQRAGLAPDEWPPGMSVARFTAESFSAPLGPLLAEPKTA